MHHVFKLVEAILFARGFGDACLHMLVVVAHLKVSDVVVECFAGTVEHLFVEFVHFLNVKETTTTIVYYTTPY